jgi:hypothetical protein
MCYPSFSNRAVKLDRRFVRPRHISGLGIFGDYLHLCIVEDGANSITVCLLVDAFVVTRGSFVS